MKSVWYTDAEVSYYYRTLHRAYLIIMQQKKLTPGTVDRIIGGLAIGAFPGTSNPMIKTTELLTPMQALHIPSRMSKTAHPLTHSSMAWQP